MLPSKPPLLFETYSYPNTLSDLQFWFSNNFLFLFTLILSFHNALTRLIVATSLNSTLLCFLFFFFFANRSSGKGDSKSGGALHPRILLFLRRAASNSAFTTAKELSFTSRFHLSLLFLPPRTMIYLLDFSINSMSFFLILQCQEPKNGTSHPGSVGFSTSQARSHS